MTDTVDPELLAQQAAATRTYLDQIPGYYADMQPATGGIVDGPRPAPASRPLIDANRFDLDRGSDLWNWVTLVVDEMSDLDQDDRILDAPSARRPDVRDVCRFLSNQAEWIIRYNDDFPASIRTIHYVYKRAAGISDPVHVCPDCGWRIQPQDQASWFKCTGCGRTWRTDSEIRRLTSAQDNVMTLGQIAAKIGVAHRTLRRWAGERFIAVGMRHGRPVYDIRTVRKAVQRVRGTTTKRKAS